MRLRSFSALAIMTLCLMHSKQTWAQESTITKLPKHFTELSSGTKEWEMINGSSYLLHSQSVDGIKIWLQSWNGYVTYSLESSDAIARLYKSSDPNSKNVVLDLQRGSSLICDHLECRVDNFLARLMAPAWMYYYVGDDLRVLWSAERRLARSYSYDSHISLPYLKKMDWLQELSGDQRWTSSQSTVVFSTGVSGGSKNKIIDLTKDVVTTEILSPQSVDIKLNENGRLWYAYAQRGANKWGVVRAGLADGSTEFDLKNIESQIDRLMKSQTANAWSNQKVLIISSIDSSNREASLILRFHQQNGDAQYLALYDIETKMVTLLRKATGVVAKVGDVFKVERTLNNRLYALTEKNTISIWNLYGGSFVKNVQSSLKNVDDFRVSTHLHLIDFKNGEIELLKLKF